MIKIILISGEICSGKDTMVKKIKETGVSVTHIDLGNLVREKFKTKERIFNNSLEDYFMANIEHTIQSMENEYLVITGLRQETLAKKFLTLSDYVSFVYLICPRHILKDRFLKRGDQKDAKITFEQAIEGDESLGMKGLQNYLLTQVECDFIKSY